MDFDQSVWSALTPILAISAGVWACMAALGDFLEFKDKNLKEWRNLLTGFKEMPFKQQNREAPLRLGQWIQVISKFIPGVGALILAWLAYDAMDRRTEADLVLWLLASLILIPWIAYRGITARKEATEYEEMMLDLQDQKGEFPIAEDPPPGYDPDILVRR